MSIAPAAIDHDAPYLPACPDHQSGDYYVSVRRDSGGVIIALGPFRNDHARALTAVARVQRRMNTLDRFSAFYTFGTCRMDIAEGCEPRQGRLNDSLDNPTDQEVADYLVVNPPTLARQLVYQDRTLPFYVRETTICGQSHFKVHDSSRRHAILASYATFEEAEADRLWRTNPSDRYTVYGTGGGRVAFVRVGDPHTVIKPTWVRLLHVNRYLTRRAKDAIVQWIHDTHDIVPASR